ncbi:MAG: AraC family transcriptional regulator [Armatimonadota bacterium]
MVETPIPPSADPLGAALHSLRMSGTFYCRSELSAPWGLALPPIQDCLWFHILTSGQCRLEADGCVPLLLQPGDLALVPHGNGHCLRSEKGSRTPSIQALTRTAISERYEILRHGEGGDETTMICGAVSFDHPTARHLIGLLPGAIHIPATDSPEREWIQSTVRLITAEARSLRPGGETVLTRLSDILVIQAIRSWIASDQAARTGWLGALRDEQIGGALVRIHSAPAHPWTVALLAEECAMSRSSFAARFTDLVGEPAMQYVTRWRMQVALGWLREDAVTVSELASRLGYQSEAAFSRAFKRIIGVAPGGVRRNFSGRVSSAILSD